MSSDTTKATESDMLAGMRVTEEQFGFRPDELSLCPSCARKNAPDRFKCIYCAAELSPASERLRELKPTFGRSDPWENAWNVVALPPRNISNEMPALIAGVLGGAAEAIADLLAPGEPVPLARCGTAAEADLLKERIQEAGVDTVLVSDEDLGAENGPQRLRRVEFGEDLIGLVPFGSGNPLYVKPRELTLAVIGTYFESRTETVASRRRRQNQTEEQTEISSDQLVIDIYSRDSFSGWRVRETGFDFSCIGGRRAFVARQNMLSLIERLRSDCPDLKVADAYDQIRKPLVAIWATESRSESKGVNRSTFGRIKIHSSSVTTNLNQFTKYSRMLRRLG